MAAIRVPRRGRLRPPATAGVPNVVLMTISIAIHVGSDAVRIHMVYGLSTRFLPSKLNTARKELKAHAKADVVYRPSSLRDP
jgi:hypothetical protein